MKKLFTVAMLVLLCTTAFAQNRVTGRVTSSEDGSGIPFASVVVKGTMNGVATDDSGAYVLTNVPRGAVLEFSSVGFLTQEFPYNGEPVVNVILATDRESLEEAMVVAYGTVKKGSYSGSAAVVRQESIKDAPVVSFEQVLAGKAPGVQVASYSGQPGADNDISIRGFGSFNAGNQPLYVIDGVPATSAHSAIWAEVSSFQLLEIFFREARRASWAPVATPVGKHFKERTLRPPTWRAVTPFADPEKPPKAMEGSAIMKFKFRLK